MAQNKVSVRQKATAKQPLSRKGAIPTATHSGMVSWLILLSLVLPLSFSRTTLDPVLSIRHHILCTFVFAFALYFFVIRKTPVQLSFPPLIKALFAAGLAYCIWNVIALVTAINLKESIFETSRSFTNLFFLFIVMVAVYNDRSKVLALCKALTIMAIIQGLVGIFQYYDLAFTNLPGNFKPYGLMANRNLFGSAQVLLLPFCVYTLVAASKPWKYISGLAFAALAASILLSQTRAAWLAAATVLIISLVLVMLFTPQYRKRWIVGSITALAAVSILVFLFVSIDQEGQLAQSLKERGGSIAQPLSGDTTTSKAASTANERLIIWGKTKQLINDHKLTGVGPGNWKIGIQAYGNKGLINEYGKYILDHAHNIYLQIAAETGIPGLLLFLGFWILTGVIGFKAIKRANAEERILPILMVSGLAAFAVDGFFSFPLERVEHTFYLLLMAGILLSCYDLVTQPSGTGAFTFRKWALVPLGLCAALLVISKERHDFDVHFYKVKAYNKQNEFQKVVAEAEKGKSSVATMDVNGDPLEMYSAIAYKELKQYDKALQEANKGLAYHPYSARLYNTLGTIYTETQNFPKAIDCYKKALSFTAKNEVALKNLAINYYNVKEYAKCLSILNQVNISGEPVLLQIKEASKRQLGQ